MGILASGGTLAEPGVSFTPNSGPKSPTAPVYAMVELSQQPTTVHFAGALIAIALGARMPSGAQLATLPQAAASFPLIFLVVGPLGEEPGGRGLLQPRLRARLPGPLAGLAVGVIWAVWHLPLLLSASPAMQAAFFVEVCAIAILMERMGAATGDSVLLAMLLHAVENTFGGGYVAGLFEGGDRLLLTVVRTALFVAIAAAVSGRQLVELRQPPQRLRTGPGLRPPFSKLREGGLVLLLLRSRRRERREQDH